MARWFPLLYQCHLQGVSYSSYLENGFSTIVSCHNPPPPPRSSLSPCLIGTGLLSQWRCVQIQLVCVMLCCLVLHSNGRSGQESSWTHTHTCAHTDTHTRARGKSSQRLTIHFPHYHTACVWVRTGPGGGKYVLLFHPGAPSKHLWKLSAWWPIVRFHFHQTRNVTGVKV